MGAVRTSTIPLNWVPMRMRASANLAGVRELWVVPSTHRKPVADDPGMCFVKAEALGDQQIASNEIGVRCHEDKSILRFIALWKRYPEHDGDSFIWSPL